MSPDRTLARSRRSRSSPAASRHARRPGRSWSSTSATAPCAFRSARRRSTPPDSRRHRIPTRVWNAVRKVIGWNSDLARTPHAPESVSSRGTRNGRRHAQCSSWSCSSSSPSPRAPPIPRPRRRRSTSKVADLWRYFLGHLRARPAAHRAHPLPLHRRGGRGRAPAAVALPTAVPPSRQLTVQGFSRDVTLTSSAGRPDHHPIPRGHVPAPRPSIAGAGTHRIGLHHRPGPAELPASEFRLTDGGTPTWAALTA